MTNTKNTKKPSRKTPAIAQALTSPDDTSALLLPHSAAVWIVQALEQYEGTENLADGAVTLPQLRVFAARAWFTRSMEAVSDALRELRGEFDRGRTAPELEAETLSGAVLDTLASYFSCVAEDGTWSAETFNGLRANLERELTQGVTVEELNELKALGDGAGVVRPQKSAQPEALPGAGGEVFAAVVAAMQPAEEIHGPDGADYVALMEKIAAEATSRARIAQAAQGLGKLRKRYVYDATGTHPARNAAGMIPAEIARAEREAESAPAMTSREYWAGRRDAAPEVTRCPSCGEPTHATESDDTGRCEGCRATTPTTSR